MVALAPCKCELCCTKRAAIEAVRRPQITVVDEALAYPRWKLTLDVVIAGAAATWFAWYGGWCG